MGIFPKRVQPFFKFWFLKVLSIHSIHRGPLLLSLQSDSSLYRAWSDRQYPGRMDNITLKDLDKLEWV